MVVIHVKVRPSPPNPSEGFLNPFLAHGTGPPRSPSPLTPPPLPPGPTFGLRVRASLESRQT